MESELITEEEVEKISEEVEVKPKKKRKTVSIPQSLESLSGRDVLEMLEFLHRRYLSWMTEAEGAKYTTLYRQVREEALKEVIETYTEIQKQNQELINRLTQLTETLQKTFSPTSQVVQAVAETAARQTVEEVRRSILDDPRVRALILIALDYISEREPRLKKYLPFAQAVLMPEAFQQSEPSQQST